MIFTGPVWDSVDLVGQLTETACCHASTAAQIEQTETLDKALHEKMLQCEVCMEK